MVDRTAASVDLESRSADLCGRAAVDDQGRERGGEFGRGASASDIRYTHTRPGWADTFFICGVGRKLEPSVSPI